MSIRRTGYATANYNPRVFSTGLSFRKSLIRAQSPAKASSSVHRAAKSPTLLFAEYLAEQLLLTLPHRQFVFTLPKALRVFLRYDQRLFGQGFTTHLLPDRRVLFCRGGQSNRHRRGERLSALGRLASVQPAITKPDAPSLNTSPGFPCRCRNSPMNGRWLLEKSCS